MNFKDIIHEMLITENTDKRKAIERSIGFSPAWADEFYNLNEKYCIWIANSFLNEYIKTHKKTIEKKYNKPINLAYSFLLTSVALNLSFILIMASK